jgi:hypothetical protein
MEDVDKVGRARFKGNVGDIATLIGFSATTVTWLKYDEMFSGAAKNPTTILKHKQLLLGLRAQQANLSFSAKFMNSVMTEVLQNATWSIDEKEHSDWIQTMAKRLRVLLRHVVQGITKNPDCWWVKDLLGNTSAASTDGKKNASDDDGNQDEEQDSAQESEHQDEDAEEEEEEDSELEEQDADDASSSEKTPPVMKKPAIMKRPSATAEPSAAAEACCYYGWDSEHSAAWRMLADGTGPRQYTKEIFEPENASEISPMWARWPDGDTHVITDLLKATFDSHTLSEKELHKKKRHGKGGRKNSLWSGKHVVTGAVLNVARRSDRQTLVVLTEGGIMIEIGQLYEKNGCVKDDIYTTRDALLVKYGIQPNRAEPDPEVNPKKRPAAAAMETPAAAEPVEKKNGLLRSLVPRSRLQPSRHHRHQRPRQQPRRRSRTQVLLPP